MPRLTDEQVTAARTAILAGAGLKDTAKKTGATFTTLRAALWGAAPYQHLRLTDQEHAALTEAWPDPGIQGTRIGPEKIEALRKAVEVERNLPPYCRLVVSVLAAEVGTSKQTAYSYVNRFRNNGSGT